MNSIKIPLTPLSRDVFAPFGDVIEVSASNKIIPINDGLANRHHDLATVDVDKQNGHAIISIIDTESTPILFWWHLLVSLIIRIYKVS